MIISISMGVNKMPYNVYGDLRKREVVQQLQELGCNVKSVHELNLILKEMGIHRRSGNNWLTTDYGTQYSLCNHPVFNEIAWHPSIIGAIIKHLKQK